MYRTFLSSPAKHDDRVREIQRQVNAWNKSDKSRMMCTARPNWLSLSTTFFDKNACHKVPIPLYDILALDEAKMTVRVEPMVSVGDITRYLIPRGYTLAVTLEIADATLGGLAFGVGMTTYSHKVKKERKKVNYHYKYIYLTLFLLRLVYTKRPSRPTNGS